MPQNAGLRIIQQEENQEQKTRRNQSINDEEHKKREDFTGETFFEAKSFEAKKKIFTEFAHACSYFFFFNKKKI